jgi:hypothetical protein
MEAEMLAWKVSAAMCVAVVSLVGCQKSPDEKTATTTAHLEVRPGGSGTAAFAPLLNRVWKISDAPYGPASGSIYIFLQNGTLLETSCVETYRIATWSVDPEKPEMLRVVEDGREAFTATLRDVRVNSLHLRQTLLHEKEPRDVTLTAVDGEFVCPDLKK